MTPKRLQRAVDIVVLTALAYGIVWIIYRTNAVLVYRWNWSQVFNYVFRVDPLTGRLVPNILAQAFATTLRLAFWTLLLSTIIGTVFGILRTRKRLFARLLSGTYVELVRNMPPLVFIFIFYFFLANPLIPYFGLDNIVRHASPTTLDLISLLFGEPKLAQNILSGIICLSLFSGAYVTEIIRAGLLSVPGAQREAAVSLGLTGWQSMRLVVLPQALRTILPALANQFVICIKDSSLISLISVPELTYSASEVAVSTRRVFEVWLLVGGLYFMICYGCTFVFGRLEHGFAQARGRA